MRNGLRLVKAFREPLKPAGRELEKMEFRPTNVYIQLDYDSYKSLESQLRSFESIETSHTSTEGYYHKALRIHVGTMLFEFQGPLVKAPLDSTLPIVDTYAEPRFDQGPYATGRSAREIQGNSYINNEERVWYLNQLPLETND